MKNKLSDRENRVLNMLLKGFEEIEIAEQMELTAKTIKSDIERIQDKWEVSSVAGVIVEACVRGLLPAPIMSELSPNTIAFTSDTLNILQISEKFLAKKNKMSLKKLLRRTAYFKMHLNIDEFLIKHVLSKNPQYRDLWLSIAEWNVDSGWFICREDSGIYLVGSLSMDDPVPVLEYADAESACAVYIKRELEYLREG